MLCSTPNIVAAQRANPRSDESRNNATTDRETCSSPEGVTRSKHAELFVQRSLCDAGEDGPGRPERLPLYMRRHINFHGHYFFNRSDLPGGRRALRDSDTPDDDSD